MGKDDAEESDVSRINNLLKGEIKRDKNGAIINWKYFTDLIKKQRNSQIIPRIKENDPWVMSILDTQRRASKAFNATSYNCILYEILQPIAEGVEGWNAVNHKTDRLPIEAHFIWGRIYYLYRTPEKMDVFLTWLWRDHPEVMKEFYKNLGLDLNAEKEVVHDRMFRELTEPEYKQIKDQIEKIGRNGLTNIWLEFHPSFAEQGRIEGTFNCEERSIYLRCDGLNYDFRVSLLEAAIKLETNGVLLKNFGAVLDS
jgi:hypothetical protein